MSETQVRDSSQQFYIAQGGELVLHIRKRAVEIALLSVFRDSPKDLTENIQSGAVRAHRLR